MTADFPPQRARDSLGSAPNPEVTFSLRFTLDSRGREGKKGDDVEKAISRGRRGDRVIARGPFCEVYEEWTPFRTPTDLSRCGGANHHRAVFYSLRVQSSVTTSAWLFSSL